MAEAYDYLDTIIEAAEVLRRAQNIRQELDHASRHGRDLIASSREAIRHANEQIGASQLGTRDGDID